MGDSLGILSPSYRGHYLYSSPCKWHFFRGGCSQTTILFILLKWPRNHIQTCWAIRVSTVRLLSLIVWYEVLSLLICSQENKVMQNRKKNHFWCTKWALPGVPQITKGQLSSIGVSLFLFLHFLLSPPLRDRSHADFELEASLATAS